MIELKDLTDLQDKLVKIKQLLSENENKIDFDIIKEELDVDFLGLEQEMLNYEPKTNLYYKKSDKDVKDPFYNYGGDSGFDLYANEDVTIEPFGRALIPTGLSFRIKDGFEIQVRSKSGLALNHGLMVLNSPGTVDNSYTGEVKVILFNTNKTEFKITKGMKIAQAVFSPVVNGKWIELVKVENLEETDRGSMGFGSTGI